MFSQALIIVDVDNCMAFISVIRPGLVHIRNYRAQHSLVKPFCAARPTMSSANDSSSGSDFVNRVLHFWFGTDRQWYDTGKDRVALWWEGGEQLDEEIREKFGDDVRKAMRGEYNHVRGGQGQFSIKGDLALVILLDQLTRNIFRGKGDAFKCDAKAVEIVSDAVENRADIIKNELRPVERTFFYTPFMHSEDLETSKKCIEQFSQLLDELQEKGPDATNCIGMVKGCMAFAKEHTDIIERFGRFPHRNEALGRKATPEELEYLQNAPRYGQ